MTAEAMIVNDCHEFIRLNPSFISSSPLPPFFRLLLVKCPDDSDPKIANGRPCHSLPHACTPGQRLSPRGMWLSCDVAKRVDCGGLPPLSRACVANWQSDVPTCPSFNRQFYASKSGPKTRESNQNQTATNRNFFINGLPDCAIQYPLSPHCPPHTSNPSSLFKHFGPSPGGMLFFFCWSQRHPRVATFANHCQVLPAFASHPFLYFTTGQFSW